MRGKLPKNITYICKQNFKDVSIKRTDDVLEDVFETFATNSENENQKETALRWAKGYSGDVTTIVPEFQYSNDPIYNVKIVNVEYRSQSGAVFKAVVHDKFLVDLRPDILMDVIANGEIKNSTIICGMLWASCGSQFKLIRENSEEHLSLTQFEEKTKVKLSKKDIKPGFLYGVNDGAVTILGEFKKFTCNSNGKTDHNHITHYNYYDHKIETEKNFRLDVSDLKFKDHCYMVIYPARSVPKYILGHFDIKEAMQESVDKFLAFDFEAYDKEGPYSANIINPGQILTYMHLYDPTFEYFKSNPYLKKVIDEVLPLYK